MTTSDALAALKALRNVADFRLRPPASPDALDALEAALGVPVPSEIRDLYLAHDGQDWEAPGLWLGNYWMPVDEVLSNISSWRSIIDQLAEALDEGHSSEPPEAIAEVYWHPHWLPIGSDGGGNFIAIDLAPGPSGVRGQVINAGRDEEDKYVLGDSATEFLQRLAAHITSGTATIVDDEDDRAFFVGGGTYSDFLAPYRPTLNVPTESWLSSLDDAWQRYIQEIGLEKFVRLTEFASYSTGITDFRPLTMCPKLRSASLFLPEPMSSLEELPDLPSLKALYTSTLSLVGVENFPELTKLTLLTSDVEIDVTPATQAPKLADITIQGPADLRSLRAIAPLKKLRLTTASAAQWNDIEQARQLTSLDLGAQTNDGSFLDFRHLTKLKALELNNFVNLSLQSLQSHPSLSRLKVSGTPMIDLSPLTTCTKLQYLELSNCEQIGGIEAIRSMPWLKDVVGPFVLWKQLHEHLPQLPWAVITGEMTEAEVDEFMSLRRR